MTREEAKKLLPIIQAFSEGRVIQYQANGKWRDYTSTELAFDMVPIDKNYRIKSEPKYRPFANAEECWTEMLKHQPIGWVKNKKDKRYVLITVCENDSVFTGRNEGWHFKDIIDLFTFADGTPFGVKVEED